MLRNNIVVYARTRRAMEETRAVLDIRCRSFQLTNLVGNGSRHAFTIAHEESEFRAQGSAIHYSHWLGVIIQLITCCM